MNKGSRGFITVNNLDGLIVSSLGGFYYVQTEEKIIECRAKGAFRKDNIRPAVGDIGVVQPTEDGYGYLVDIKPRKNFLVRPPLANIDVLVMVISSCSPKPNTLVIDKMIAIAEYKEIEPVIVFTKTDLEKAEDIISDYRKSNFKVFSVSSVTGEGVDEVKDYLKGKISAFCGNSGVGKSTLLNRIDSRISADTGTISKKLGRGRHTTRQVELFPLEGGGYIADTPGFSAVELQRFQVILKDELQHCFREFEDYIPNCKFTGCSHTKEKGCSVLDALAKGKIPKSRHISYVTMYEDAKNIKEWEL